MILHSLHPCAFIPKLYMYATTDSIGTPYSFILPSQRNRILNTVNTRLQLYHQCSLHTASTPKPDQGRSAELLPEMQPSVIRLPSLDLQPEAQFIAPLPHQNYA